MDDPRQELVRRLLEYKKYRDAASILEERSRLWQQRYPRLGDDLRPAARPGRGADPGGRAVGPGQRVRPDHARIGAARPSNIVYDETPIHVYMPRIHARLLARGRLAFSDLFVPGMHKSALVGIFLAMLELVRHAQVRVEQNQVFGEIWLLPGRKPPAAGLVGRRADTKATRRKDRSRMIENLPVKTLVHKRSHIEGYSRAAVQTYWRMPELKVGFDLGAQPWSFMGTPTWFVSHTHMDHLMALPVYVARRRMMKMEPPTIYLPEAAVEPDREDPAPGEPAGPGPAALRVAAHRPGDEIELSRELVVTVSATTHTVPSLGFVVWERRRSSSPSSRTCRASRSAICGWPAPK